PKETHDAAEYFDDEDFDKEVRVHGVSEGGSGTGDSHCDTAEEVAGADREATLEQRVACVGGVRGSKKRRTGAAPVK
ncbi:hypothetical protein C0992_002907, partial [Termitomyces sp. T32_za158]